MKLLVFYFIFFSIGCVTTQISPQQRRAMQVKLFDSSSYNNVFRAFKTVLQDEGYIIKNQDMQGGLIVAHSSKGTSSGFAVLAVLSGQQNYQTGTTYEVSVNLEEIRKNNVESRVIIQKVASYNMGGSRGNEILDPKLYRNIYGKVIVEVERRKAQKR
ncbi:MAG: hypothetical protein OXM55_07830 [Bdellovibrionales bacterium]|nr:hypothetical protein [Bdellovibrionales bacterium]